LKVAFLAALLLLHDLGGKQVLEIGAQMHHLVEHVLLALTDPGGHGGRVVRLLVAEVLLHALEHQGFGLVLNC